MDIQPSDVRRFGLEVGVVRLHVPLEAMRLQSSPLPRLRDEVVMNPQQATELPRTPVRAAVWRQLPRLLQHAGFHRRRQHRRQLPVVLRPRTLKTLGHKPSSPPIDVVAITRDRRFNRRVRRAIIQHQNHSRPAGIFCANLQTAYATLEFESFISREGQRHMAPNSTSTASLSTSH